MADISKIKLPSGNTYNIVDAGARTLISQLTGISLVVAWNGTSTPVVANIPAGVTVTYNSTDYTGTLSAESATAGAFYLVYSTASTVSMDVFDEYVAIGETGSKTWERIGSTSIDLSALGALAYKDSVSLNKGSGVDVVKGAATFTTTVTPTTTNIKATATGTALSTGSDSFLKMDGVAAPSTLLTSVTLATDKLVTTTVPNVTAAGSASSWAFAMGTGNDSETLIISGANGSAPTLGTAITCATGDVSQSGSGAPVGTSIDLTGAALTTGNALTSASVSAQPTVALSTGATAGTGVISVATGITSASTSVNNGGTEKVAKYSDLSVSVS